jgi:hypothetical protein
MLTTFANGKNLDRVVNALIDDDLSYFKRNW